LSSWSQHPQQQWLFLKLTSLEEEAAGPADVVCLRPSLAKAQVYPAELSHASPVAELAIPHVRVAEAQDPLLSLQNPVPWNPPS
jgi:hypothetical protein